MKIPSNYHQGLSEWVSACRSRLEGQGLRGSYQDLSADILEKIRRRVSPDSLRKWEVGGFVDPDRRITHEKEEMVALYCSAIGLPRPEWLPSDGGSSPEWSVEMIQALPISEVAAIVAVCLQRLDELGYNPSIQKPKSRTEFKQWLIGNLEFVHAVTQIEKPRLIEIAQGEVTIAELGMIGCKVFKESDAGWLAALFAEHEATDEPEKSSGSANRGKRKRSSQT